MKRFFALALAISQAACTSMNEIGRDYPDSVTLISSDAFASTSTVDLTVCVTDGLKRVPQSVMYNHTTYQEVIKGGYRVEMRGVLGGTLMLSADILNDGTARLFSSKFGQTTHVFGASAQKEVAIANYRECMRKYQKPDVNK